MKRLLLILSLTLGLATSASAQEAGTKARLAFEHWYCMNLIGAMSESNKSKLASNYERHGQLGIDYARDMLKDLHKYGDQNNDNWSSNAPLFFRWSLAGPSDDFILGRLFEASNNTSVDEIYYENKNLDNEKYLDESSRDLKAKNEYSNKNCNLLR
jgi:hypothetical protein